MPISPAYQLGNSALNLGNVTSNTFVVTTDNTPRMYVTVDGNLVVGTSTARARLQSTGATQTTSPALGNPSGGALLLTNTDENYGWLFGVSSSGRAWAQAQRVDGTATAYDMLLQPTNGNVAIGSGTQAYTRLTVAKIANASFTGAGLGHAILTDSSTTLNAYTNLDFTTGSQGYPIARMGMQYTTNGSQLVFGTSNSYATGITNTAMLLDYNGNVGIASTSPVYRLDVAGTASANWLNLNTNIATAPAVDAAIYRPANGTLGLVSNASERMRIDSLGNVGIATNTITTGYKLQVQGSTNITGYATIATQPMISAKHTATETPGAGGTFVQWTTNINQGGGSFTSGVYTVPVAGKYLITINLLRNTAGTSGGVYLNVNNANIYRMFYVDGAGTTGYAMGSGSFIYSLAVNDTVKFTAETANAWYGDATGLGSFTINMIG